VALAATYTRTVDSRVAAAPEMPGAIALLRDLRRRGLTVHLFSATPERSLGWILESRGWTDFFDSVHGSPKPKSDSLGEISRGEERHPDQIAVVGDGVDDEYAAASVGCLFIPVGDGSYARANPGTQTCALSDVPSRLASVSRECAPQ
jgi:phosphoglycolate phosphatase-like HAD superfamily hydrolase